MTTLERSYGIVPIAKGLGGGLDVLLVQQRDKKGKPSHWSFSKGHQEEGESPKETAIRELKEETGLSLEQDLLSYSALEYGYTFLSKEEGLIQKINTLYPALLEQTLDISSDAPDIYRARWMNISTAKALMKFSADKDFLEILEEWINKNIIKS